MLLSLDQSRDTNNQELYRILKIYDAPDFVKNASFEDIGVTGQRSANTCANKANNTFPYHTPAATWVSAGFLLEKKAEANEAAYNVVWSRLVKAAEYFGIKNDIDKLAEKVASFDRHLSDDELPDSDYAIVINDDGSKERHLRLINKAEIKAAAAFLHKFRDRFTYDQRQIIAEKIFDKAGEFGADLGDYNEFIDKQAGFGDCASEDAAELVWSRVKAISKNAPAAEDTKIALAKIARSIMTHPKRIHEPGALTKIAGLIDQIDRAHGLAGLYGTVLNRPEDVLFTITKKTAAEVTEAHFSTATGNLYRKDALDSLKLTDVRDLMGVDFAERVSDGGLYVDPEKMAEETHTLPRGDAKLVDRLLQANGIEPQIKEAEHKPGISKQELKRLSEYHVQRTTKEAESIRAAVSPQDKPEDFKPNRGAMIAELASTLRQKMK